MLKLRARNLHWLLLNYLNIYNLDRESLAKLLKFGWALMTNEI